MLIPQGYKSYVKLEMQYDKDFALQMEKKFENQYLLKDKEIKPIFNKYWTGKITYNSMLLELKKLGQDKIKEKKLENFGRIF